MTRLVRHAIRVSFVGAWLPVVAACAPARYAQEDMCPQLALDADPRALRFSATLETNASLQSFFTAARGVIEIAEQAEALTTTACRRIAIDLGANPSLVAPNTPDSLRLACAEATQRIQVAMLEQPLQTKVHPPACVPNERRLGQCEARCTFANDVGCAALCEAEARLYSNCHAARIEFSVNEKPNVLALTNTLSRNLPWLIHAYSSLSQRLEVDVVAVARVGTELPQRLRHAEPQELACVGLTAAQLAMAAKRLKATFDSGTGIVALLGIEPRTFAAINPKEAM